MQLQSFSGKTLWSVLVGSFLNFRTFFAIYQKFLMCFLCFKCYTSRVNFVLLYGLQITYDIETRNHDSDLKD